MLYQAEQRVGKVLALPCKLGFMLKVVLSHIDAMLFVLDLAEKEGCNSRCVGRNSEFPRERYRWTERIPPH